MWSRTVSASERETNVDTERATGGGGAAASLLALGTSVSAMTTSKWSRSTAISMSV